MLAKLGYQFTKGKLVGKDGAPFAFIDQRHYEEVAAAVREFVTTDMCARFGLRRMDASKKAMRPIPIYGSLEYEEKPTLFLIIQGSGTVRPGLWSNSLAINDSLETGTIFPYLERGLGKDWGVLVLNPNEGIDERVPGHATPMQHAVSVWDDYVQSCKAKQIYIVAHSFGGKATQALSLKRANQVRERVVKVALTDSVHWGDFGVLGERSINWRRSREPLDTDLGVSDGVRQRSAGTDDHPLTNSVAFESVWRFFEE